MGKQGRVLVGLVALILFIGSAYLLYDKYGGMYEGGLVIEHETDTGETETDLPTTTVREDDAQKGGSIAPDFAVVNAEGKEVTLHEYLGKPIVLNFWASWCSPCKSEMPDFEAAYRKYGGEIEFLIVNMTDGSRETVSTAQAYIASQGYTFPVYFDTEMEAAIAYGVNSLPTSYFIDANGCVVAYAIGRLGEETLEQGIDRIRSTSDNEPIS